VLIYRIKRLRHLHAVRVAERERALRAEAAMKAAPELKSPGIRFFNERGQTSEPAPLPEQQQGNAPAAEREPPDENIVALFRKEKPKETPEAQPAPEPAPEAKSAPAPAAAEPGDLLAGAVLVARLEPLPKEAPPLTTETPEEKAERDYFEEFFRPKK
jgi:hypothetical protein